ncbi:MAG: energy transducer TonB [Prevotella sp.]|nr:energy transducer TonB [Prevotella sp.]
MEQKKTRQADMEQRRTTGFLLGLVLVLSVFYVAMEWNMADATDDVAPLDLDELMHESELVPMSNLETTMQVEERQQLAQAEQLHVVDDDVELQPDEELVGEGDDDDALLEQLQQDADDEKALAALDVDPANPLNFRVVEELPQYPGGAVEFMKWLTKNLRYPAVARNRKTQGKVVAVFYVEKDGSVTGIKITQSLSPECDREALRVLRMMPTWTPGIQNDKPCRTKVCIPIVFKL